MDPDTQERRARPPRRSRWPDRAEFRRRLARADELLRACRLCPLRCGARRLLGERGPCGLAGDSHVYKSYASLNEEVDSAAAWRVFLGGCNLRCLWCDEAPAAFRDAGRPIVPHHDAAEFAAAIEAGLSTISLLGGEPTLHVRALLQIAAAAAGPLPLVLNTNLYCAPEVFDLLDGVVARYLADFKFASDECAAACGRVQGYFEVVSTNLASIAARTDVIVRHVLVPGHFECCFRPLTNWLAAHLPQIRFQLYDGYVPCGRASRTPGIDRLNAPAEVRAAQSHLATLNLALVPPNIAAPQDEAPEHVPRAARPRSVALPCLPSAAADFPSQPHGQPGVPGGDLTLTVGADGRVYCHDLTPGLAALLSDFCVPPHGATA